MLYSCIFYNPKAQSTYHRSGHFAVMPHARCSARFGVHSYLPYCSHCSSQNNLKTDFVRRNNLKRFQRLLESSYLFYYYENIEIRLVNKSYLLFSTLYAFHIVLFVARHKLTGQVIVKDAWKLLSPYKSVHYQVSYVKFH